VVLGEQTGRFRGFFLSDGFGGGNLGRGGLREMGFVAGGGWGWVLGVFLEDNRGREGGSGVQSDEKRGGGVSKDIQSTEIAAFFVGARARRCLEFFLFVRGERELG